MKLLFDLLLTFRKSIAMSFALFPFHHSHSYLKETSFLRLQPTHPSTPYARTHGAPRLESFSDQATVRPLSEWIFVSPGRFFHHLNLYEEKHFFFSCTHHAKTLNRGKQKLEQLHSEDHENYRKNSPITRTDYQSKGERALEAKISINCFDRASVILENTWFQNVRQKTRVRSSEFAETIVNKSVKNVE